VRILDRYLLREFLLPWLYSLDALALLLVVDELLFRLDDFLRVNQPASRIVMYYVDFLPGILVQALPVSLLLGVLFCLAQLGRHNELQAMRASGVGLARVAVPLFGAGLFATGLTFLLQENLLPSSRERMQALIDDTRARRGVTDINHFFYANEPAHRDWYARSFQPQARSMTSVKVDQRDAAGRPLLELRAERAEYRDGQWWFHSVSFTDYRAWPARPVDVAVTNFPFITESPKTLALEGRNPDQLTTSQLRRHIAALYRAGRDVQAPLYETTLHYRYAFPWSCLLVVWLGVPLGLRVSRRGPALAIGTALGLVVLYYLLANFALALGKGGHVPAVWAAWTSNGLFALIGAGLLFRLR
jgi:lipopolysaccharide export system permease protein